MRTVVALYDRLDDAQQAVRALIDAQFNHEDITFIARDATGEYAEYVNQPGENRAAAGGSGLNAGAGEGAGIGAVIGGLGGLLLGLGTLAIPGIGPVIAAGPIIAGLAGASAGAIAGGLIGGLVDIGIPEEHANYYAEGVRRGGSLVMVRTQDQDAEKARQIMNRFNPVDIETHSRAWREVGWSRFDQNAQPLPSDQMEFNRESDDPAYRGQASTGTPPVTSGTAGRVGETTDRFSSGMDEHLTEDVYGKERSHNEVVDLPVTGSQVESEQETDVYQTTTGEGDWAHYDAMFNHDYMTRFGGGEYGYDYYQPAYRYGFDLAMNPRYSGYTWVQLEPEVRQDYERRGLRGAWDDVKDAVRYAWETVAGR